MPAVVRNPLRRNACRPSRAWRAGAAGFALAVAAVTAFPASARTASPLWQTASLATAGDGTLQLRFNVDLLAQLGLAVRDADGRAPAGDTLAFDLVARDAVRFAVGGASVAAWHGGEFVATRGFRLVDAQGTTRIDLATLHLRPRAGSTRVDFVGADGRVALTADAVMAVLPDDATLRIDAMDIRLPGGVAIADAQARLAATLPAAPRASSCAVPNWPGSGGGAYVADLALDDISVQAMRCGEPGCEGAACVCDGPGGSDAAVVFAPRAELSNTDDDNGGLPCTAADPCSADLPWNAKFSPARPPYGNDQHPLLIWNLYRLDPDGRIAQVGRSGVKHAFVALNVGCDCSDAQVLGRGCADAYSTNNNDNNNALGPRSEIVPATVQWGRCGALDDDEVAAPNPDLGGCDSVKDATGNTRWSHRLTARESQIDATAHPGSRWLFEAWYLVRDDVNIDNSMGFIEVVPGWNGTWTVEPAAGTAFRRGAALDAWADPAATDPFARVTVVDDAHGRLRLAARVQALGGGRWRYDYALMNFTFAQAQTAGAEPNLRVLSTAGVAGFAVPLADDVAAASPEFDDGDLDTGNDWNVARDATAARWLAAGRTLDWGTLMRYSLVADAAPVDGTASALLAASPGAPALAFASLVPGPRDADRLFADGLERRLAAPQHYTDTFFN